MKTNNVVMDFSAGPNDSGKRLDRVLRKLLPDLPLAGIYKAFRLGQVKVNGSKARMETRLKPGDSIIIRLNEGTKTHYPLVDKAKPSSNASAFPPFEELVLFENNDIVIINKPRGMLSHGSEGADVSANAYFTGKLTSSLSFRPAPLHRLDRNTTGLLCISKSIEGARAGTAAFREREIAKYYLAVAEGRISAPDQWIDSLQRIKSEGRTVKNDLCGKKAITSVFPLACGSGASLCLFRIETGLTHQIRAQASMHGHPLRGDRKYGSTVRSGVYILHCLVMVFPDLARGIFPPYAQAPVPDQAARLIEESFGESAMEGILSAALRITSGETT